MELVRLAKKVAYVLDAFMVKTRPVMPAPMPQMSIHIDLSVGFPVKKRDTSDPKESDSLIPKATKAIPAANSPIPSALFIMGL